MFAPSGPVYAGYAAGTKVVLLEPDVAELFPDSKAVNDALCAMASPPILKPREHFFARVPTVPPQLGQFAVR